MRIAPIALATSIIAATASAQPPPPARSPWYVTVAGGALLAPNTGFETSAAGLGVAADVNWGTGFGALAGVGYRVLDWLRVEGEVGYVRIPVDSASARLSNGLQFPSTAVDATLKGFAFFANGIADWRMGGPFVPYAGVGLGLVNYISSSISVPGVAVAIPDSHSATNFAFQVKSGLDVALSPSLVLAGIPLPLDRQELERPRPHVGALDRCQPALPLLTAQA
jgi:opacity protein-like surface antigen